MPSPFSSSSGIWDPACTEAKRRLQATRDPIDEKTVQGHRQTGQKGNVESSRGRGTVGTGKMAESHGHETGASDGQWNRTSDPRTTQGPCPHPHPPPGDG
jgi:hypothetical protein